MTANTGLSTPAAATNCCSIACSCFSMERAESPVMPASASRLVVVVVVRVIVPEGLTSTMPSDPTFLMVVVFVDVPDVPPTSKVLSIGSILLPEMPPSILVVVLTVSDRAPVAGTRLVISMVARVSGISMLGRRLKVGTPISMSTFPSTSICRD